MCKPETSVPFHSVEKIELISNSSLEDCSFAVVYAHKALLKVNEEGCFRTEN